MTLPMEPEIKKETETHGLRQFPERLRLSLAGRSIRGFAKDCGLSEGVLRSYLRGDTYPSLDRLEAIALAADVNDGWLATGVGTMKRGETFEARESRGVYRPMNEMLIGDIIEQIETCLQASGREIPPAKKKELVLMAYDLSLAEGAVDRGTIERLVKLVT